MDVVHVQADFWGAFIGHRFAARHRLPVVHTMHNRVDVGIRATAPFPGFVLRVLNAWQRRALGGAAEPKPAGHDGWSYLRRFAGRSDAVTAPSSHFARRLEEHGVVPAQGPARRRCGLERHRRRRAARRPRHGVRGARSRPAAVRVDRPHESREAPAAVPRGARGVGCARRGRGDRRRGRAARGTQDRREAAARRIRSLRGQDAVCRRAPQDPGRGCRRADLDRLRDAGHDGFRGCVARHPVGRERPRHRGRTGCGPVGCRRRLGCRARRGAAPRGRRHRGRHRAGAGPVGARPIPPVVADRRDARGLPPRHRPEPLPVRETAHPHRNTPVPPCRCEVSRRAGGIRRDATSRSASGGSRRCGRWRSSRRSRQWRGLREESP